MVLPIKPQPTLRDDNVANVRANILMTHGSYAAAEALTHVAIAHKRLAEFNADRELADHWDAVATIFEDAKRKLGALT